MERASAERKEKDLIGEQQRQHAPRRIAIAF